MIVHHDIIPRSRSPAPVILSLMRLAFTTAAGLAAISADRAPLDTRHSITVLSGGTILARSSLGSALKSCPNAADRSVSPCSALLRAQA